TYNSLQAVASASSISSEGRSSIAPISSERRTQDASSCRIGRARAGGMYGDLVMPSPYVGTRSVVRTSPARCRWAFGVSSGCTSGGSAIGVLLAPLVVRFLVAAQADVGVVAQVIHAGRRCPSTTLLLRPHA